MSELTKTAVDSKQMVLRLIRPTAGCPRAEKGIIRCHPLLAFLAFSCRQRCLCPSCHQKRTLLAADTIAHTVCQAVPHRQLVCTIPKRLRLYFRYDRGLLGELARAAWESVVEVYRDVLGRDDLVPGLIAGIQTFGELVHFHPLVVLRPPLDVSAIW